MADVALVAIVLVFFGLCVLYVRFCDRMIRNDDIGGDIGEADAAELVDEPVREVVR